MTRPFLFALVLLATYAALSTAAGLLVAVAARAIVARGRRLSANAWIALRIGPVLAAAVLTLACVWPAFLLYEPVHAHERPGPVVLALAAVSVALFAVSSIRLCRTLSALARFRRQCLLEASICDEVPLALPIHVIPAAKPVAALVGILRPMLVMSEHVVAVCSTAELRAIGAHESAHLAARDNAKRMILDACPDVLRWTSAHRRIAEAWSAAGEDEADDRAVSPEDAAGRLALAALLLKIARLGPACPVRHATSALIEPGGFERRVRRLLEPAPPKPAVGQAWVLVPATTLLVTATVAALPALADVHALVEAIVRIGR